MAIRWNATTKKWLFGSTGAVAVTVCLILALCKSCDAQNAADDAKQTAEEAMYEALIVQEGVSGLESKADSLAVAGKKTDGKIVALTREFEEHRDSTIVQGVHQAAVKPAAKPAPKPAEKPAAKPAEKPAPKPEQPRPESRRDTASVRPVTQVVVNPQEQSGVVQQAATVAPTNVDVKVEGENRGAAVVGTSVSATQSAAGNNNTVVQQYATDAPTDVQVTVSGDNRGVVAVGTNVHVEQTVLPDDYVKVTVQESCTVVFTKKAVRQMRRRCR